MTDELEDRFGAMLRDKAAQAPTVPGDPLVLVQARVRRRARRRNSLICGAAALCVAAVAVTVAALSSAKPTSPPAGPLPTPNPSTHQITPVPSTAARGTIPSGVQDPTAFTDSTDDLWVASWSTGLLIGIGPHDGKTVTLTVGRPNASIVALAAIGNRLYDIREDAAATLEVRDALTGAVVRSQPTTAEVLASDGAHLWTSGCCGQATPAQTVRELDPATLAAQSQVVVPEEGELPQLRVGGAGIWLLSENGTNLRRIDGLGSAIAVSLSANQLSPDRLAVGQSVIALASPAGTLTVLDPSTGKTMWQMPIDARMTSASPRDIAISGDDIFVAVPNHVLEYSISRRAAIGDFTINAAQLAVGPHGVWATSENQITELIGPVALPLVRKAGSSEPPK